MFSVSGKHDLKIRRHWPLSVRVAAVLFPLIAIGLLFWKGFNNSVDTPPIEVGPPPEVVAYQEQISELRKRNAMLESELSMQQGLGAESREQTRLLTEENAQLKEELAYLQKLVADATAEAGVRVQDVRIQPVVGQKNEWRYRILLVQGGNPKDDFEGELRVVAYVAGDGEKAPILPITDRNGGALEPYKLKFKYYERIENVFRTSDDQAIDHVDIQVYKNGTLESLVTRSVSIR
ncbi:MAG: hypothetical protein LBS40_07970 [Burkholderiales bacterium]|jgi:hypothetical protein|nr:hypothetical protein [Burkholderiales bacterium]